MPYFSVLIANFNNDIYIDEAIHSVLNQTYNDWEIIIVDDCSTDNSLQVLAKYENNSKISIYKNIENKGAGYTKDRCIQLAHGEICAFLDSDDALGAGALNRMVNAFREFPHCCLIYSTHFICDSKLSVIGIAEYVGDLENGDSLIAIPNSKSISHFATFKRKDYNNTEGIPSEMKKAVDHYLYFLLEEQGPVQYVNEPLYYYRHHSGNISLGRRNIYAAMFWDHEARRRAFKRRMDLTHKLYLSHENEYKIEFLYSKLIALFYFHNKSLLTKTYDAIKLYIKSCKGNKPIIQALLITAKAFYLTRIKFQVIKRMPKNRYI